MALVDFANRPCTETLYVGLGGGNFVDYCLFEGGFNCAVERDIVMKIVVIWSLSVLAALFAGYMYGKSRAETKIVEKQVEVVKYVAQKRAKIQALPNARRDELLELMRAGRL